MKSIIFQSSNNKIIATKALVILLCIIMGIVFLCLKQKENFVMWQLPSQINTIGNSYVFRTNNGKVIVIDGGVKEEAIYLRGFLAALGNKVEIWFVSHPHPDHIGALNEILKVPGDVKISRVYHSELSSAFCKMEPGFQAVAEDFYSNLKKSGVEITNVLSPSLIIQVGQTKFKILSIKNESITVNPYNNSSIVIRVWDSKKSAIFLGDAGKEEGDQLLNGPFRKDLDCDYLQMAHHGQNGVSKDFYRHIKFKACLWPSPSWIYNNDIGKGFNTHTFETVEIRNLVDSLGIKKNYSSCAGLSKID